MRLRGVFFTSLLFTSLVLAAGLAHLLSLPNKIDLPGNEYLISQKAYRGWSLTGIIVVVAIISTLVQVIITRKERRIFFPATIAFLCLVLAQIIFWWFTYPANQQTDNWTYLPDNWMQLRNEWEYSHAVASILDLLAFIMIIFSVLTRYPNSKLRS